MRHPTSLTLRLTLLFSLVAVIAFTGFGWFIERSIQNHFNMEDDAELEIFAGTISQVLAEPDSMNNPATLEQRLNDIVVGHRGAIIHIIGQNGQVLFATPGGPDYSEIKPPTNDNPKQETFFHWQGDVHAYRVLTRTQETASSLGDYTMLIAVTIDHHLRFLESFRRTLWLMIASGIVVMGLMGWFAVRQGHSPLRSIIAQIRQISASELNTRLSPDSVPNELTDLALAFNEMLERMEEAFQRLTNFSADIAHELRTPVTNLLTQTQVALSKNRSVDEYREILYSNMEEYERMAQMIGDMLFLAKAENGLYHPEKTNVDLEKELRGLFEFYEAWAEEKGVSLRLEGHAIVPGDRLMLRRALGNLLSNAIRHTASGDTVSVHLSQIANQSVSISVENPGPTIPEEHIPRLFDRFYRVDASRQRRSEGAGLGLAITKSIVDIHGGKIEATSSEGCTQFRVTLPA